MQKHFLLATAVLSMTGFCAYAEDKPALVPDPSIITPVVAPPIPTPSVVVPTAQAKAGEADKPIAGELKDGTRIEIGSEGTVTLTNTDGSKNTAPDGVFTLKDNTTFSVKSGRKVAP